MLSPCVKGRQCRSTKILLCRYRGRYADPDNSEMQIDSLYRRRQPDIRRRLGYLWLWTVRLMDDHVKSENSLRDMWPFTARLALEHRNRNSVLLETNRATAKVRQ